MVPSFNFVLFGATGDLSRNKIIPALYQLFEGGQLPTEWRVLCIIRKSWQQAELARFVKHLLPNGAKAEEFAAHFEPFLGDLSEGASFLKLKDVIANFKADKEIFYLSVSPSLYKIIIENLRDAKMTNVSSSVMIEKPFGRCLNDARELTALLESFLEPRQILRIDHYLGKDAMSAAKNLAKDEITEICTRFIEDKTVGERGAFYDSIGAFLDVGQNHLLMMLATSLKALKGTPSRLEVLKSLSVIPETCVRGQYDTYQNEKDVKSGSATETYFKVGFESEDALITILGGKGFGEKAIDVNVNYKNGSNVCIDFALAQTGPFAPHAKVILAALSGETDIFVSRDEVFEEWRIAEDALKALRAKELRVYPKGVKYQEINNK